MGRKGTQRDLAITCSYGESRERKREKARERAKEEKEQRERANKREASERERERARGWGLFRGRETVTLNLFLRNGIAISEVHMVQVWTPAGQHGQTLRGHLGAKTMKVFHILYGKEEEEEEEVDLKRRKKSEKYIAGYGPAYTPQG